MIENISQQAKKLAANLETSVGELVSPKSTPKHLFGTGKDGRVSLNREVLFKYIDLTGVGCRRNHMEVRISAADMFVDLRRSRYGLRYIEFDSRTKILTKSEYIYQKWYSELHRESTVKCQA